MKLDVSVFNNLRHKAIRLKEWTRPSPPAVTANLMATVVTFARYMGMTEIPKRTVEKIRTDPYFRYCFYLIKQPSDLYKDSSNIGITVRDRVIRILKDADSFTNEDLYFGLREYMNNFVSYMPGGYRSKLLRDMPDVSSRLKKITSAVDSVLKEKVLVKRALTFRDETEDERKQENTYPDRKASYAKRVEYLKLCLDIFNILVKWGKFDPEELWK